MESCEALDIYLDFLDTSSSVTEKDPISTPRIDSVLHHFKQRVHIPKGVGVPAGDGHHDYETRLVQLEKQLTDLLQRSKSSPHGSKHRTQESQQSSDSDDFSPTQVHKGTAKLQTSSSSTRSTAHNTSRLSSQPHEPRKMKSRSKPLAAPQVSSLNDDRKKKTKLLTDVQSKSRPDQGHKRDNSSVQALTKELDLERERRWKAEQAAGRLVEHVRAIQSQLNDTQKRHELTVVKGAQIETELNQARETTLTLQTQIEELQGTIDQQQKEIEEAKHCDNEQMNALRSLEANYRHLETERIQERSELTSRVRESEASVSGHQREIEMLRKGARQLKSQLQQMQELLASRERDHQKELEKCKPLDSKEVQELVSAELERERSKTEMIVEQHKQRVLEQQKAYKYLEDEFRMALRIEAERYQELQRSYNDVCSNVEASRQTAVAAVQKEQRATSIVAELTAIVKEQKGRITELNRSKQESLGQLKERVAECEVELVGKNKMEVKLKLIEEENSRLLAQVTAQESVIDGLREERKLWGKELAHQGATLAQDRGRMEAQVDALSQEVKSLQEHLQSERDASRIKGKQIEDQLQTIHQLKQSLVSKEHELQSEQLDWQKEQQALHLQLEQSEATSQEIQEQIAGLYERKEQLKEEVASVQEQMEQWKTKYCKLKAQWDEKIQVITTLEENMTHLQETFAEKESKLVQERDLALEASRTSEQRLKSCDDAFRGQLEAKQRSHDKHVMKIIAEKKQEIDLANERVAAVEGEMRVLLTELAREKKNMEAKFQKLSRTFQELQQDNTDQYN